MPETVTIESQAVIDLLVEVLAVETVLEDLVGVGPTRLTKRLDEVVGPVAVATLGDRFDHAARHEALEETVDQRAAELLARKGTDG